MSAFTHDFYRQMLEQALAHGYQFVDFETFDPDSKQPSILLRHDIDLSVDAAYEMAKIEYELGIRATYFWRLNSTFYSLMSQHDHPKFKTIHDEWGHYCGLHFDPLFYEQNGLELYDGIKRDNAILSLIAGQEIKVLSQHRPASLGMTQDSAEHQELMRFFAYNPRYTQGAKYISDSARNWREGDLTQHIGKHHHIQVLVHPVWWGKEDKDWQSTCRDVESRAANIIHGKMDIFIERNIGYLEKRKRENI